MQVLLVFVFGYFHKLLFVLLFDFPDILSKIGQQVLILISLETSPLFTLLAGLGLLHQPLQVEVKLLKQTFLNL